MIRNKSTREGIFSEPGMKEKYDTEYPAYAPDPQILLQLKVLLTDKTIIAVLGTWCGDSRLQLPRFYKILDDAGMNENAVTLICVNEMKKAANGLIDHLNIVSVPTFIFMENDKEIGRIIESPKSTLENDIVEILTK
jgi:thiol-disulfide isomerase/thioredoxin